MVLLLAVFGFRLFPERDVTVFSSGESYRVSATFDTREEALAAAAVDLEPGDRVLLGTGGRHTSLAVQRARPIVVESDGQAVQVRTQATTISGALAEAGVDLRPGDRVYLDGQLATARGPLFGGVSYASRTPGAVNPNLNVPADAIRVAIVRARPVSVYVDTLRVDISSASETVAGVLADLGMTVREGDLVRPALDTPVTAGTVIRLAKARTVNVRVDGKDQLLYTHAITVADVLNVLGVDLGPDDSVEPTVDTVIQNGMGIVIALTRQVVEDVTEPIAPTTVYETDATVAVGTVKVVQGTPGVRLRKFNVTYKNGVEVSRQETGSPVVVTQAVPTRQVTGTKAAAAGSASKPTLNAPGYNGSYNRKVTVDATWYNASHGGWARSDPNYGRTASGAFVDWGICATDPSFIPMGTRFYVPDYGMCVAADTGGAIKGAIIDLGFPETVGDPGWGRRVVDIYIVD
ncbi:MAG: DUF348 domain-containing protein [Thermoflexaceae bacterium]|nr:DUF348 domain-containing protein [Thermoflexaceae bacterium]